MGQVLAQGLAISRKTQDGQSSVQIAERCIWWVLNALSETRILVLLEHCKVPQPWPPWAKLGTCLRPFKQVRIQVLPSKDYHV